MATDPLLEPFQLKHLTLKNRILSTSHEPAYAEDGKPKLRYQLYHEEKAKGGIALTMFGGSTNVAPDSPSVFGQLYAGDDSIIPYYKEMAARVHEHGAALMSQLTHMGRRTIWDDGNWLPTIAPSLVREPAHRSFPKEMEPADIRRVVESYGQAARRVKEGDIDGVEVIAYGHLVDQFWTPLVNRRKDEYGGSLDNRLRFAYEVFEEIRKQVGDEFVVGIRMSGSEDRPGGLSQEECTEIALRLARTGMIDFVSIVRGFIESDEALSHTIPGIGTPLAPHLPLAAALKKAVDLPVFHAARITDLATARHAIAEGLIDMVGMTRAHIADPHIVRKLEAGLEDRIRLCVGASYCLNRLYIGADALCIQNPATGREATIPHVVAPAPRQRTVVVVGAGPAGLEAARVSAERGHTVTLYEAAHEPGGQIQLAARATERRGELIGIVDWLAAEVRHAGIDLRLNTFADGDMVRGHDPDVVVVATGGRPSATFFGEGSELVASTWDMISGSVLPADDVLIFDDHGGDQALSCAERLAEHGSVVEIVSPDRHVGHDVIGTNYPAYLAAFYRFGVTLTPDHRLQRVERHNGRLLATLYNEYTKTTATRVVDQVVVEHGTAPLDDIYFELKADSSNLGEVDLGALLAGKPQELRRNPAGTYELYRIGDAVASRNIHAALYDARRLCMVL